MEFWMEIPSLFYDLSGKFMANNYLLKMNGFVGATGMDKPQQSLPI